jgi:hypothetical protein
MLEIIYSSKTYRGRQTKRPSIASNAEEPKMNVKISAEVITNPDSTYPIIIKPYKFDISQFGEKERRKLEFKITNVSEEDLDIKLIDMPNGMFELKLPNKVKAGKTVSGKIAITDEFVSQEFEKSLTIELNDKAISRFTVPVKRTIRIPGKGSAEKASKH